MQQDRRRGSIYGLAIGDALGAAVEFQIRGHFDPVTGYRAGGPHGLDAGEWTDDTSLALALADSLVECGWDLQDQMRRYLSWWRAGRYAVNGRCFDIGSTTARALRRFEQLGDPLAAGDPSPRASGNGSIMRLAPVPAGYARLYPNELERLVARLVESSQTTHASEACLSACAYMGLMLVGLIHGQTRDDVLSPTWPPLTWLQKHRPLHPEVAEVAHGSFRRKSSDEVQGSGYVVRSLEAALWAFHDAPDFRTAVLRAVNLGDDADTTGAVCGQLAGAYWGETGIPEDWRANLAGRSLIDPIVDRLLA